MTYLITSVMKHKRQKPFFKNVIDKPFPKTQTLKFLYPKHKQLQSTDTALASPTINFSTTAIKLYSQTQKPFTGLYFRVCKKTKHGRYNLTGKTKRKAPRLLPWGWNVILFIYTFEILPRHTSTPCLPSPKWHPVHCRPCRETATDD